jgi:hypothetical protein
MYCITLSYKVNKSNYTELWFHFDILTDRATKWTRKLIPSLLSIDKLKKTWLRLNKTSIELKCLFLWYNSKSHKSRYSSLLKQTQ